MRPLTLTCSPHSCTRTILAEFIANTWFKPLLPSPRQTLSLSARKKPNRTLPLSAIFSGQQPNTTQSTPLKTTHHSSNNAPTRTPLSAPLCSPRFLPLHMSLRRWPGECFPLPLSSTTLRFGLGIPYRPILQQSYFSYGADQLPIQPKEPPDTITQDLSPSTSTQPPPSSDNDKDIPHTADSRSHSHSHSSYSQYAAAATSYLQSSIPSIPSIPSPITLWERFKLRLRLFLKGRRPDRRWRFDDILALFSWIAFGNAFLILAGTTTFFSVLLWLANSLQFQGD